MAILTEEPTGTAGGLRAERAQRQQGAGERSRDRTRFRGRSRRGF